MYDKHMVPKTQNSFAAEQDARNTLRKESQAYRVLEELLGPSRTHLIVDLIKDVVNSRGV